MAETNGEAQQVASEAKTLRSQVQETAANLLEEWRVLLTTAIDETEKFTKEKPLVALSASFAAGVIFDEILHALFRGRRR